jgi:universal stress protein E
MTLVAQGSVHLLHAFDVPGAVSGLMPPSADEFADEFADLLDGIEVDGRTVGRTVRNGPARLEIVEMAHMELPDVIVMGTAGRTGVGRALLGSTAHEVLEHLPSDVLLVRSP